MANSGELRPAAPAFPLSPDRAFFSLWHNRQLVRDLVVRDIASRYRGSALGIVWSLLQPLILLTIYTVVFGLILPTRWPQSDGTAGFALTFFAGLIVFNFFAECISRSPLLILNNPNFVKKVVFPLETLSWMAIGSALFQLSVSVVVWLIFHAIVRGVPSWTVLWLPVVILPLAMLTLGASWMLASVGVYIRDVTQLVGLMCTGLLFLSPVFYATSSVPERFRALLYVNPLTFPIEQARHVLLDGQLPDLAGLALFLAVSCLFAWAGYVWFQRTRPGFTDVI